MYLTDFVFDGVKLSTLGFLVGAAVTSNSNSSSAGSKLNLVTVQNKGNNVNQIITTEYSEPITATFDIIKYSCNATAENEISDSELSYLMRWLNRTEYCKFQPIYDDASFYQVYYEGTFTEINTIQMGGHVVGLTLTFTASTPYGYADYEKIDLVTTITDEYITYYDESDEIGGHYPEKVVVTMNTVPSSDPRLVLMNLIPGSTSQDEGENRWYSYTVVHNCIQGEVITFDCIHKIITTSMPTRHTTLYKDFNYQFPKIVNTPTTTANQIGTHHPAKIEIYYKPIKKVGIIV